MKIVVLVKVVPDLEELTFDPETKTVRRSATPLFQNPFDQRAVLLASQLRKPGDTVEVVSLGPPDAEDVLRDSLALGADRATLITDRAFAGSDTWVTSEALARLLRRLDPGLVLAGRFSTDSSTGQVPVQVASRLSMPVAQSARAVSFPDERHVEVLSDTETGWARYRLRLPALVSVGEKAVRSRKPTPEERALAASKPIERRSASDLDLQPQDVGQEGSRTKVLTIEDVEPDRRHEVFDQGTPSERAEAAARRIAELLSRPRPSSAPLAPPGTEGPRSKAVLVLACREEGGLDPEALPLVSEGRRLGGDLWPTVVGYGPLSVEDERALARAGAARAWWLKDPGGTLPISAHAMSALVNEAVRGSSSVVGLIGLSTDWSREVIARSATSLGLGLAGDALGMTWEEGKGLLFRKPSFGGGLLALIACKGPLAAATVRPGVWTAGDMNGKAPAVVVREPQVDLPEGSIERLASGREVDPRFGEAATAWASVGVGMGLGGPEMVPRVLEMARPLGAALVATRKVVDAGWVPPQLQVGLTGRSIAPELFLTLGSSGKANFLVGVRRARVLAGINPDPQAPLFASVDVGIVGRWEEVLPWLVAALRPLAEARRMGETRSS